MFYKENDCYFDVSADINIIRCGKRLSAQNHHYGPVVRKNYWLIFIKEGHGTLCADGKSVPIGCGDIMCTFPNSVFHYTFDGAASIYWICFNAAVPESILNSIGLRRQTPVKKVDRFAEAEQTLNCIYDLSSSDLQKDTYQIFAYVYQLFSLLTGSEKKTGKNRDYAQYAIRYMNNNYTENVRIDDIADALHLERTYFTKLFKKETGLTPVAYLSKLRIQKACRMLCEYTMSIGEIAASVGFDDAFYFSRKFKKIMGISPSEYKKDLQKKDAS